MNDRIHPHHDTETLRKHLAHFEAWQRVKQYAARTVEDRHKCINLFLDWAEMRSLTHAHQITLPVLERYAQHLHRHRKSNGQPLNARTQHGRLTALRAFFKYLVRRKVVLLNPAAELELPRLGQRLPRAVLTPTEVARVLAQPDVTDVVGLRDRAILEVMYSTGLRRAELVELSIHDLDFERGTALVRRGKGNKDRMVAIGGRALGWVDKYLCDSRPQLVVPPDDATLFVSTQGRGLAVNYLSQLVNEHVLAADLGKSASCHALRHAMATQMHENGADIRHVQAQLGHAELGTTAIYTQVSIRKLKEVHTQTHPAEAPPAGRIRAGQPNRRYSDGVASAPFIAYVNNGRLVLDVATDLPDGTTVELHAEPTIVLAPGAEEDGLDDEERAALHLSLARSVADLKAGRTVSAEDVMAELDARILD